MQTIIDKGPKDPGPAPAIEQGETTSSEHAAWKAAKRDHEEWQKVDEGKPRHVRMHAHDATHAVAADPERYEIVPETAAERRAALRARLTTEQRVAALEARLDEMEDLDEDEVAADPVYPQPEPEPQPVDPMLHDERAAPGPAFAPARPGVRR